MAVPKDVAPCRFRQGVFCTISDSVETQADTLGGVSGGSAVQHQRCMDTSLGDGTVPGAPVCHLVTLFDSNLPPDADESHFPII